MPPDEKSQLQVGLELWTFQYAVHAVLPLGHKQPPMQFPTI